MKIKKNVIVLSTLIMAFTTTVVAGQVGSMTTFTSGTPAVAAEVNGNFTEHTTQINDNATAIAALKTGAVSVISYSFRGSASDIDCKWWSTGNDGSSYFSASSTGGASCTRALSGISLPDGVTLTNLSCTFHDNTASGSLKGTLNRVDLSSGVGSELAATAATADDPNVQNLSESNITTPIVDNSRYGYFLIADFAANAALGSGLKVYGCTVDYITAN